MWCGAGHNGLFRLVTMCTRGWTEVGSEERTLSPQSFVQVYQLQGPPTLLKDLAAIQFGTASRVTQQSCVHYLVSRKGESVYVCGCGVCSSPETQRCTTSWKVTLPEVRCLYKAMSM